MAKEIGTQKLAYQLVPTDWVNRETATWFREENIAPYTKHNTDGASIYKQIGKDGQYIMYETYTKNSSLNERVKLKGFLELCAPLSEECTTLLCLTSWASWSVNSVTDFPIQKCMVHRIIT